MIWTKNYEHAIDLTDFNEDEYKEAWNILEKRIEHANGIVEKTALQIIQDTLSRFIGYDTIVIEIDGYKCVTKITDEWNPIEISPIVYPFDFEGKRYPMQEIELTYSWKY